MSPWITVRPDGVIVALKVQPRASRNSVGPVLGSELKLSVTAPPVDSAANLAVINFLAERLGCPKGAVQLLRGQTSRHKTVFIRGLSPEQVEQALQ